MNTAIAITAIIAAVVVINIIATTIRDTAQAKRAPAAASCRICGNDRGTNAAICEACARGEETKP